MTKQYRGKYPLHIRTVTSAGRVACVTTNDGTMAQLMGAYTAGELPRPASNLLHWQAVCTYGMLLGDIRAAYGADSAYYRYHKGNHADHAQSANGPVFDWDATQCCITRLNDLLQYARDAVTPLSQWEVEAMARIDASNAPREFSLLVATARDVIARSISMHPSLFADSMRDTSRMHATYAGETTSKTVADIARTMAAQCREIAVHIGSGDIDAICSTLSLRVQAFTIACKLQCVPHSLRGDIMERAEVTA